MPSYNPRNKSHPFGAVIWMNNTRHRLGHFATWEEAHIVEMKELDRARREKAIEKGYLSDG